MSLPAPMEEVYERKHPIYWFDDGSVILDVEVYQFKVHHTLVSRHSRFFSALSAKRVSSEALNGPPAGSGAIERIVLNPTAQIRGDDVEALLQHLYHDVPLGSESTFPHVASILRVSSPQQLDYPELHKRAKDVMEGMFPTDPASFTHKHPLHDALPIVTEFNLRAARKAILYSLVTTTEFDISNTTTSQDPHQSDEKSTGPTTEHEATSHLSDPPSAPSSALALSAADSHICTTLMTRLIDHFSPILFTAPAASHMACTDAFAGTWMTSVIQPAIDNDGVYKPLETLQLIKDIDWEERGLCASCVAEKREEWTGDQRTIWSLIDTWIASDSTARE